MTNEQPNVGNQADTCPECSSALAADQRYCVNCGWRRGGARVDYETQILRAAQPATAGGPAGSAGGATQQWSPIFAIGAIALLGIMLLLGVLIGKKDNGNTQTVAAQAPVTTTAAAAAPTDTTAAAPTKTPKAAAAAAPGQGDVVQGGTGSTAGVTAANTHASAVENAKSGPDQVATQGKPAALDPGGQAGGGSSATCIGC